MAQLWSAAILDAFARFSEKFGRFLPNLLALITILIVGIILAYLLRFVVHLILAAVRFDNLSERWGLSLALTRGGWNKPASHLVCRVVFWLVVFISLIMGITALGLEATTTAISNVFLYLPQALAAVIILVAGYLLAVFLARASLVAAVNAQIRSAKYISRAVRILILFSAVSMAVVQLGIAREVVVAAFSIFFGGVVLALALAFGLAGRDLARDFLERRFGRGEDNDNEKKARISHI
jgi:hypothetical protein